MPLHFGTLTSHQAISVPHWTGREQLPPLAYIVVSSSLPDEGRAGFFRRDG